MCVRSGLAYSVGVSFLPRWLTAFTLHVRQVARGRLAWVGVFVASAERDVFPTVTGLWPGDGAQHSSLEVGDRLLRLGDADLRGVGPVGFFALAHEQLARERPEPAVPVVYEHAGERRQTYLPFVPLGVPWRMIPLTSAFVLTGALVLLRRPGVPVARAFFLSAIAFSLHWTLFFGGRREVTYAWALVFAASSTVMLPLMLRTAAMFPDEAAPEGGPSRWTWVWALYGPIVTSAFFGAPLPAAIGLRGLFLANAAF